MSDLVQRFAFCPITLGIVSEQVQTRPQTSSVRTPHSIGLPTPYVSHYVQTRTVRSRTISAQLFSVRGKQLCMSSGLLARHTPSPRAACQISLEIHPHCQMLSSPIRFAFHALQHSFTQARSITYGPHSRRPLCYVAPGTFLSFAEQEWLWYSRNGARRISGLHNVEYDPQQISFTNVRGLQSRMNQQPVDFQSIFFQLTSDFAPAGHW